MVDADTVAAGSDTVRHDDPKVEALISRANQHVADVTNKLCTLCPPRDEKTVRAELRRKLYNDALAQCDTDGEATLLDPTMAQERFWLLVCNDPDPDAGIDIEFARFLCELGEVAHTPDEMRCIPAGYSSRYDEDDFPTIERTDLHPTTGAVHTVTYRSLASVLAEFRDMVARYDAYHARTQALTT